jgi:hypothetical protein
MNKVLENPFYYLDNFQRVLDWIGQRYGDLLAEDETAFIATFPTLPQAARALFVRMVMRKGCVFRQSKLNYAEIGCTGEAARALLGTGWIESDPVVSLETVFALLSKAEIAAIFGLSAHERGAKKSEQLAALRVQYADVRPYSEWVRDADERVLHVLVKPLCDRLRLIFFGNAHQDWSEFVLSDLGVYRYEEVAFLPSSRGFCTRRDVDDYIDLLRCKEQFLAGELSAPALTALLEKSFANEWIHGRRARLLFQIAQHREKQRDWHAAHMLYMRCGHPGARTRAIRVLEKDGQVEAAHALLAQARLAPENEAEHQALQRMAPRLARALGYARTASAPAPAAPKMTLSLPPPAGDANVETAVRDHLAQPNAPVFYVENALINALFGLLCWPAIFHAVPGAFFHPFHRAPADLFNADFHSRRATQFAVCLAQLDDGRYRDTIRRRFHDKHGIESPFLDWRVVSAPLIELALACIPAAHLRKWFERILQDIKANRCGFPDLIQFWPKESRYRMIEVKGPGDRLQDSQLRWLAYCAAHQMPVAVCYLQWNDPIVRT